MSPDEVLARALALVPGATAAPPELVRGQAVVIVPRERLGTGLRALRDDPGLRFDRLSDVTAVDYLPREPRFEVVYQLHSLAHGHRLRVKVPLPGDDPEVPSAAALWKSALWAEREAWDMFGIRFTDHPDLRRILMYPEFQGHPLRKDYPVGRRQPLVPERDPIADPWPARRAGV
ncbi:MAG TPA: NADH-quinone oxidoreductase subunit C [Candidatus Binatia bacterium]|nr:NADH-quinone oxidoreductase subunit C [Candidatus Binatia bacterium]